MTLLNYAVDGAVARITLDNPATVNALSPGMAAELTAALGRAEAEARAIVLSGAGRGFCSGADLGDTTMRPGAEIDGGRVLDEHYNPLMRRIRSLRVPFITSVHGAAAGIGAALALAGDIVVASDDAFFLQAFSRMGLVADGGAAYLLTRAAGRVRALELMLLGEKLPAARALEWGLVTRVVPGADLTAATAALAERLANGPTLALGSIRSMVWSAMDATFDGQLDDESIRQRAASRSEDFREGMAAFTQKRSPRFAGR